MRRIYFLVPDLDNATKVTDELLLARIEEKHIHVIAKEGTELGQLPEATLLQTSDVIPALERGLAVGGATGILAGVAALAIPARPTTALPLFRYSDACPTPWPSSSAPATRPR